MTTYRSDRLGQRMTRRQALSCLATSAMSLAYPLPTPGQAGIGEQGPVTVAAGELGKLIGTRQLTVVRGNHELALIDTPLGSVNRT